MPVRVRLNDARKPWESNSDPKRLDLFYTKLFGPGGDKLLSEEIKWLAITHKSFEQGARGFNDRLAFLVSVESQSINVSEPDERIPFRHPALEGLPNLFHPSLAEILSKKRLAVFAASLGMKSIIRWYPRMKHDLNASGIEAVLVTSLYAIVGALALEKGGQVSTELSRKYIIEPLISG
ncbi:putative rnase iii domain protein [Golovinomyces cichoracearum]|uniref:Putative rnase iii domain protein n=1 Tax=Golovinomyces cichoracearum TaxID=62708 RepID=A0A420IEE0_9PEZI|nr:putative rnase iii domain protein [Golovinomyces cichoracearum]